MEMRELEVLHWLRDNVSPLYAAKTGLELGTIFGVAYASYESKHRFVALVTREREVEERAESLEHSIRCNLESIKEYDSWARDPSDRIYPLKKRNESHRKEIEDKQQELQEIRIEKVQYHETLRRAKQALTDLLEV